MDLCHLKTSEMEPQFQKYKRRVVLRGDVVKDDSGSYAVFIETRFISISNDSRQNHGYHLQIARLRWTSSRRSICKGNEPCNIYDTQQSCAQVYLHAPINEYTRCQCSGGQRMGKARKIVIMANDQSEEQKGDHRIGTERTNKSSFHYAGGHLSSRKCAGGTQIS